MFVLYYTFSPSLWQHTVYARAVSTATLFYCKTPNFQPASMVHLFPQNTVGLELRDQFIRGDNTVASFGETHVGELPFLSSCNSAAILP